MEENKNYLPYIITVYGVLETKADDFYEMQEELRMVGPQSLISKADAVFVEADVEEYKKIKENGDYNLKKRINVKLEDIRLIEVEVSKEKVIAQDIEGINKALINLRKNIRKSQNKLKITFIGWNNDCELFERKEIRNYVSKLFNENKDLFYFLTEDDNNSKEILACIADFKAIRQEGKSIVIQDFKVPEKITEEIIESIIIGTGYNEKKAKEKVGNLFAKGWED